MKAILVKDDRSLVYDNVPDPVLLNDDCLIKIEAAALNRADLMQREGDYPPPPGCPEWMGLEIAGTIVEMADGAKEKSNFKIGDKVCALLGGGGYAEYANVKYDMLMPIPNNCSLVEAAAILDENECKTVAFEDVTLSVADLERMKKVFAGKELVPGASKIADDLRLFKDADEIETIKRAQAITDAGFSHMLEWLTPNVTEIEAALELEFFMRKMGSEGVAFETIAVSGSASSRPHGVPRNVKLEKGFFTMDFGAKVDGYCSDMTRTVVIGKADEDIKKLYNTVLTAQKAALDYIEEGAFCKEADLIARRIIDNAGYEGRFGHGLGHGVGMYIHEAPRLSRVMPDDYKLERGHIVTVEPGIYIEGLYGCRIEDMVGIMPDGSVYNFTHSKKDLIELF